MDTDKQYARFWPNIVAQGGHGYLERAFGMCIDNLLEVEMVLANGDIVVASESQHPDLFWAVRGGGALMIFSV
jgi:FAD/FMN-containing dehydrogenase